MYGEHAGIHYRLAKLAPYWYEIRRDIMKRRRFYTRPAGGPRAGDVVLMSMLITIKFVTWTVSMFTNPWYYGVLLPVGLFFLASWLLNVKLPDTGDDSG